MRRDQRHAVPMRGQNSRPVVSTLRCLNPHHARLQLGEVSLHLPTAQPLVQHRSPLPLCSMNPECTLRGVQPSDADFSGHEPPPARQQQMLLAGSGLYHQVRGTSPGRERRRHIMELIRRPVFAVAVALIIFFAMSTGPCAAQARIRASGPSQDISLRTGNGLVIQFNQGRVAGVALDSKNIARSETKSGLWIEDYKTSSVVPVNGKIAAGGVLSASLATLHVQTTVHYTAVGNAIVVEGSVKSDVSQSRAINVIFGLPIAGDGLWWWNNIDNKQAVLGGNRYVDRTYPFCAVTDPSKSFGIGIAIPPDSPSTFSMAYDSEFGLQVKIKLGLSPSASGPLQDRASFRFVIFRVDPRWGLRDAAKTYYARSPAVFNRRAPIEGLWLFDAMSNQIPNPHFYAFHEGAPDDWKEDKEYGILTFPYVIVGQREFTHLPVLPQNANVAERTLDSLGEATSGSSTDANLTEIIKNSGLRSADGKMVIMSRNTSWGGNSLTFPTDASPYLYGDSNRETVGKDTLKTVGSWLEHYPEIAGIYVDSLYLWGSYEDFDAGHFRYARIPLSYDVQTAAPVIPNENSQREFLDVLDQVLHPRGKLVFCNGISAGVEFESFDCDILGVEGLPDVQYMRTIAYQKPALILLPNTFDATRLDHAFTLCAALGIFPSMQKPQSRGGDYNALTTKYVPIIKELAYAGWEPITYAESADPSIRVERFGPKNGQIYFTLYNTASTPRGASLEVETSKLNIPSHCLVSELLSGATYASISSVRSEIPPGGLAVVRCKF